MLILTLFIKDKKINHNNYGLFFGADEGTCSASHINKINITTFVVATLSRRGRKNLPLVTFFLHPARSSPQSFML